MIAVGIICSILSIPVLYILLLMISPLFVNTKKEYSKNSRYFRWLLNSSTGIMRIILRIRLKITGKEKIPKGRFLLVSNHRSNFDPLLTWYVFRKQDIAFISKKENFKIPFFGRIIRRCCFMSIDRENARNAAATINHAADLLKNDEVSIGVYPEGTRSKQCVLLPFRPGVFKIAQKACVPIVVMTLKGTENIHKNRPFRKTVVHVDILKVIMPDQHLKEKTAAISDEVRKCMEKNLEQ